MPGGFRWFRRKPKKPGGPAPTRKVTPNHEARGGEWWEAHGRAEHERLHEPISGAKAATPKKYSRRQVLKNALVGLGVGAATYFGGRAVLDLLKNRMKVGLFKEFRKQNRGITERQVFADLKAVSQEFRTAVLAEDMLKAPTPILAKYGPGDLLKAKQILLAEAERLKAIIRQNREVGGPNKDRLRDIELLALSTQTEYSRRYGPNTEVEFGHWLTEEEYLALEQEYGAK